MLKVLHTTQDWRAGNGTRPPAPKTALWSDSARSPKRLAFCLCPPSLLTRNPEPSREVRECLGFECLWAPGGTEKKNYK